MGIRKTRMPVKPTRYNAEIHVPMLREIFARGGSRVAFLVKAGIVNATFYVWLNLHPEFSEAYELGTLEAELYWENYGQANAMQPGFNWQWYSAILRNRFSYSEHRKLKISNIDKVDSANAQFNLILKEVAQGNLTGHEIKQLAEAISVGVKINESTEMVRRVEELEAHVGKID